MYSKNKTTGITSSATTIVFILVNIYVRLLIVYLLLKLDLREPVQIKLFFLVPFKEECTFSHIRNIVARED